MSKIIYDITHLISWKGNLTGIPRTTDEIAQRLKLRNDAIFVTWDVARKEFRYVNIDYYYEKTEPENRNFFKGEADLKKTTKIESLSISKKIKLRLNAEMPLVTQRVRRIKGKLTDDKIKPNHDARLVCGKLNYGKDDIFFIPCGVWDDSAYIDSILDMKNNGLKIVYISYDILPIVVPQFSGQWGAPMKNFINKVVSRADVVFSISEHTKLDLSNYFISNKLHSPKIVTIKLGDSFMTATPRRPSDKKFNMYVVAKKADYILCAGTVEARKNHALLYYVYKLAKSKNIQLPKLVIAGRHGNRTENIISFIKEDPEVNQDIILLNDVSDGELSWLYDNCRFTIYPSFYEGWGLPIAESIARGVPCIASNTSSMPEVAPNIAYYVNPLSTDEILDEIVKLNNEKEFTKARSATKKYKLISWNKTTDMVVNELESLKNND